MYPRVAADWQNVALLATSLEIDAVLKGIERGRMWQVIGRMAATGEQLGIALAAAIEADFWRQLISTGSTINPAHEMGRRAMAELQAHLQLERRTAW